MLKTCVAQELYLGCCYKKSAFFIIFPETYKVNTYLYLLIICNSKLKMI